MSSGRAARVSFRALCISAAVPSKNRPHPVPLVRCIRWRQEEGGSRTTDEQRISSKDNFVTAVFEKIADTVLGVAGRVESFDLDAVPDGEGLAMGGRLVDFIAVFTSDDGNRVRLEHLCVTTGMVVVASAFISGVICKTLCWGAPTDEC